MESATRLFTVEVESLPAQASEDDIEQLVETLLEQGVDSPAVLVLPAEGRVACTGQVETTTAAAAFSCFLRGWSWIGLAKINVYEGTPCED